MSQMNIPQNTSLGHWDAGVKSTANPAMKSEDFTTSASPVEDAESSETFLTIENHIWIYTAPLVLLLAVVGNITTICVMGRQRMRGKSTSVYLRALAVGDLTFVVIGIVPEWLGQMKVVELWELHPWVCKTEMYLFYTSLDYAIWVLVAFTCDRVIAVRYPMKKRHLSTPGRATIVCGIVFALANVNAHVFWTRGEQIQNGTLAGNCRYRDDYYVFEAKIRPWLVLAFALLGPFLIIAVGNLIILSTVNTARVMRRRSASGSMRNEMVAKRMRGRYGQTTLMCLVTCCVFLLLVLPSIVLLIGKHYWRRSPVFWLSRAVASQLTYINHSINMVLYSLTGSKFRREMVAMFRRQKDKYVTDSSSSVGSTLISMTSTSSRRPSTSGTCRLQVPRAMDIM